MYIVGEGPSEMAKLPLALRCLSYLINSFVTDIIPEVQQLAWDLEVNTTSEKVTGELLWWLRW